jgi:hypothetical protein
MVEPGGIILVWDLDKTLVSEYIPKKANQTNASYLQNEWDITLNSSALQILKKANELKGEKVSAIFLLTNNSDRLFIQKVIETIEKTLGTSYIFDLVYDALHENRIHQIKNLPKQFAMKSMIDVQNMLKDVGYSISYDKLLENGKRNIFFMDDMNSHELVKQSNFIHITPPFNSDEEDKTDYSPLTSVLGMSIKKNLLKGGQRKKRKTRTRTRKHRKNRTY